jgi:hypothetical protein
VHLRPRRHFAIALSLVMSNFGFLRIISLRIIMSSWGEDALGCFLISLLRDSGDLLLHELAQLPLFALVLAVIRGEASRVPEANLRLHAELV